MPTNNQFLQNHEHRLLGLMLSSLLAVPLLSDSATIADSFLVAHFGIFLLWQPIIKKQAKYRYFSCKTPTNSVM